MKNTVIGLIVLVAAALIYQQFINKPAQQPEADKADASEHASATQAPVEVINELVLDAANGARVFIIEPANGAVLKSPVKVVFGIENMQIAPAGQDLPNSGHHHLLIDLSELPALDAPLPANDNVIHFGKGQTETTIELEPGDHSLQLLLGNYLHVPHAQPVISEKILIDVIE